jgi:regulator of protease activity HflC (stomatin/prohibitin superfamily)
VVRFIFGLILIVGGLGFALLIREAGAVAGGVVAAIIGVVFVLWASLVQIPTRDIGVVTVFGRPEGPGLTNGVHWKAPWASVTKLDGRVQTDTYASNGYNGSTQQNAQGGCINVRIARQATACVNVSIRWQLNASGIDYVFRNYRDNDNIRNFLLHRDLQSAVNVAFANYDPLGIDQNGDSTEKTNAELGTIVQNELTQEVGQYLSIESVLIPIFNFDPDTQTRLNQLQLQVAQTRIAVQAKQTAIAQAAANKALARSVSNDPGVLESKCLDILAEAVQKGQALPAGFSCFGGAGAAIAVK